MRIACIYIPGFAQQAHVRTTPHLQGSPFIILAPDASGQLRVGACSRRAREQGVSSGMSMAAARARSPQLVTVPHDSAALHEALSAAADVLTLLADTVEVDPVGLLFAELPSGVRAAAWGHRALSALTRQGFCARVGVADNRFTAWAATRVQPRLPVRVVPGGGATRFLAPLGLEFLPLGAKMQKMYARVKVKTLGEFAALPPPSIGRAGALKIRAWQDCAAGRDKSQLVPFERAELVREGVDLAPAANGHETIDFMLLPLVDRVVERLHGRGQAPTQLRLTLSGATTRVLEVGDGGAIMSSATALANVRAQLHQHTHQSQAVTRVEVSVTGHDHRHVEQRDLFQHAASSAPPSRAPVRVRPSQIPVQLPLRATG